MAKTTKKTEEIKEVETEVEVGTEEEVKEEKKLTLEEARQIAREKVEITKDHTQIITDELLLDDYAEEISTKLENKLMTEIITQLKAIVREKNLAGLSAPQIGWDKRIFVINFNGTIKSYINPIPTSSEGLVLSKENCSSIPGKTFIRPRNRTVTVTYETPLGQIKTEKFMGAAARIMQHHIDHLNGLILSDVGFEIDDDFEKAPEIEQAEVIKAYFDALDVHLKELNEDIAKDEDASKLKDAIAFLAAVERGEVEIVEE